MPRCSHQSLMCIRVVFGGVVGGGSCVVFGVFVSVSWWCLVGVLVCSQVCWCVRGPCVVCSWVVGRVLVLLLSFCPCIAFVLCVGVCVVSLLICCVDVLLLFFVARCVVAFCCCCCCCCCFVSSPYFGPCPFLQLHFEFSKHPFIIYWKQISLTMLVTTYS